MSSKGFVKLEGVGKFYPVYESPKDRLKEIIFRKKYHREFWALKDISFEVHPGETLGVIGDNGAGKSTLLKIVAGTLKPSEGKVSVHGRVSAILELGMGFHPEMTGIENIFLSGHLMGLTKKEIEEKLEDIVGFSELGDFINQPVKTYSSGMYVRLAFSIATAVDPDILVIDEALSVGDSYFQKKSLDRIMEFRGKGKTIIFCSHNMYHITHLCNKAVWLHHGRIRMSGSVLEVVEGYEEYCRERSKRTQEKLEFFNPLVKIASVDLNKTELSLGEELVVTVEFKNPERKPFHVGIAFKREDGTLCFGTTTLYDGLSPISKTDGKLEFRIPKLPFISGRYEVIVATMDDTGNLTYDGRQAGFRVRRSRKELGMIWLDHLWKME